MKFQVTFKSPDALHYALRNVHADYIVECHDVLDKFVEYSEVVKIEFDTEEKTATVLTVK
jgi:hypothetical protein